MGWIEQRYLVGQEIYDQIQKLTSDHQKDPVQAQGTTRNDTNLHVEPGRDTEHLYQILSGEKLALLKRGTGRRLAQWLRRAGRSLTPGRSSQAFCQPD